MAPCDSKGKEYTEADDKFVDSPDDLVGKEVNFVFKIVNCRGLPNKYRVCDSKISFYAQQYLRFYALFQEVQCKYKVYLDEKDTETDKISLTANPDFQHKKIFKFKPATRQVKRLVY